MPNKSNVGTSLPTTRQSAIREAIYQGRHSAIEDKCGGETRYRSRRSKWEALCAKSEWSVGLMEEAWNCFCTAYADAMLNGEKDSLREAMVLWHKEAGY